MVTIGFTMPLAQATGSLGLFVATTDDITTAKHDLRSLLLTNWGERPMHRDLGCNLREFLFEQIVPGQTEVLVEERITSQVQKWLPFLSIKSIDVSIPQERPNSIHVDMQFFLISRPDHVDDLHEEVSA
jgi:phage baseplate assembly protein W